MDNRNTNDVGPSKDTVAGATGGAGGAVAGAALGSLAGPIGTIIGGLAGAVGGWWAGRAVADSPVYNNDDDAFYQNHHQSNYGGAGTTADQSTGSRPSYNDVRPAYQLGHLAGANPDYSAHSFDDVEPHLKNAYSSAGQNDWTNVRQYAQDAYSRGRNVGGERLGGTSGGSMGGTGSMGTTGGNMAANSERIGFDSNDLSSGHSSGSSHSGTGMGSGMGSAATSGTGNSTLGDYGRDLKGGASRLGDKTADALDDFKDRIDGNPDSRPGRDSTDRSGR